MKYFLRTVGIILLTSLLSGVIFVSRNVSSAAANYKKMSVKDETIIKKTKNLKSVDNTEKLEQPISILLLGLDNDLTDTRGIGEARTDTMILGTINPKKTDAHMVAIPRDTWMDISDDNEPYFEKINAAYTFGGVGQAVNSVEKLLDTPIEYYVTVDFEAVELIIDAIGGIEVDVPYDMNENFEKDNSGKTLIHEGRQTLNGEQALIFSRIRKVDDDIKRGERQQQVILATIDKITSMQSITQFEKIMNTLGDHVKTNMPLNMIYSLAMSQMKTPYDIESSTFGWQPYYTEQGSSAVKLNEASSLEIQNKIRTIRNEPKKEVQTYNSEEVVANDQVDAQQNY